MKWIDFASKSIRIIKEMSQESLDREKGVIEIVEQHSYQIKILANNTRSVGDVFKVLEDMKNKLVIEQYSVS